MTVGIAHYLGAVEGGQHYVSYMRVTTLLGQFEIDVLLTEYSN